MLKKMIVVMGCLLLGGCVSKAMLEEILQKIDHNNIVIIERIEKLEGEKEKDGNATKQNVPAPQAK